MFYVVTAFPSFLNTLFCFIRDFECSVYKVIKSYIMHYMAGLLYAAFHHISKLLCCFETTEIDASNP